MVRFFHILFVLLSKGSLSERCFINPLIFIELIWFKAAADSMPGDSFGSLIALT